MAAGRYNKDSSSGYTGLANAVVETAAKDYIKALRKLKRNPSCISAQHIKDDCERFFKSDWFCELTEVDGIWLMETLRKEIG